MQSTGSRCAGFSCCGAGAQQLWLVGSRAQAQQLWRPGLVALRHVGSSQTRARTCVPGIGRQILNHCTTREALLTLSIWNCIPFSSGEISFSFFFLERILLFFKKNFIYLFGCTRSQLQQADSLVAACGLLSCGMRTLSCGMHVGSISLTRDQTWAPALGAWSLNHCTTREVPGEISFIYLFIYLFIYFYFWLCWVFVSVRGLSLVAASGGHSSSRCAGLSLLRPLLLRSTGSR